MLEGVDVRHLGLVPAEDLSSGTKVIGEVFSVSLPHHIVPSEVVDFSVKRYVVGRPITYSQGGSCGDTSL